MTDYESELDLDDCVDVSDVGIEMEEEVVMDEEEEEEQEPVHKRGRGMDVYLEDYKQFKDPDSFKKDDIYTELKEIMTRRKKMEHCRGKERDLCLQIFSETWI